MNKFYKTVLGLGFSLLMVACADNNTPTSPTVDDDIVANGLTVDLLSDTHSIPVKSEGKWTASLPEDCEWAEILNPEGEGDADLVLYVDDNTGGVVRSVPVTITTPAGTTTFNLVQDITVDGEPATNAEEAIYYANLASSKGLGQGYDLAAPYKQPNNGSPTTLNFKNASVINVANLVDYFKDRKYFRNQSVNKGKFYDVNEAMFETKKDSLKVTLSVKISYGAFKFDMKGSYLGNEDRITDSWHLNYSQDFTTYNASLDYASITSDYWDHGDNGDDDERVVGFKTGLLNSGFVTRVKKIINATDDSKRQIAMKNLVDMYGTGVVISTNLGGNVALDCYVDTATVRETLKINGSISAAFQAALFSVEGGVSADYVKTATASLNNSCHEFAVRGGGLAETQALLAAIRKTSFTEREVEGINKALQAWANSIRFSDNLNENTAEILTADVLPLWLFVPEDIQDELREYILNRYPTAEAFSPYRPSGKPTTPSNPEESR